ncbi:MAG: hypothetical protein ACKO6A_04660 [Bacteroidota bacterium]
MTKRKSIISYDKLTIEQKKQILREYPDGYINHLTTIKTPTGEILDALIWETEDVVYLIKISKILVKPKPIPEDEEDEEDDFDDDKVGDIKDDELGEEEDEEEDDEYDKADSDEDEDKDKDED